MNPIKKPAPSRVIFTSTREGTETELELNAIPASFMITGGKIEADGNLIIDGLLKETEIVARGSTMVNIGAQGKLENCTLHAGGLLLEGEFDGVAYIRGDVEVAATAKVVGSIVTSGDMWKSKLADARDLAVKYVAEDDPQVGISVVQSQKPVRALVPVIPSDNTDTSVAVKHG